MTCERHERDLALYVESDLPAAAAAVLERHLRDCPRCLSFLRSLEESQQRLKSLAAQPLDGAALVELRRRVLEAASHDAVRPVSSRLRPWAVVAASVLLAVTFGVMRSARVHSPRTVGNVASLPMAQLQAPAASPVRLASDLTTRVGPQRSTPSRTRARSRDAGSRDAAPARPLTSEEADQLARAIVALSRIERVPRGAVEAAPGPATDVVRLATADPAIVIYWQIEPNGGS